MSIYIVQVGDYAEKEIELVTQDIDGAFECAYKRKGYSVDITRWHNEKEVSCWGIDSLGEDKKSWDIPKQELKKQYLNHISTMYRTKDVLKYTPNNLTSVSVLPSVYHPNCRCCFGH